MICPRCHSLDCRRSRRRGFGDLIGSMFGARPWRCRGCDLRFHAWAVPVSLVRYAHCSYCGNFDLQRLSSNYLGETVHGRLIGLFGAHVYRCGPCRNHFPSLRPFRRILPTSAASVPTRQAS
jgi:hypothetical protein